VLLCRLLLDANRPVTADALIEALWEERPPPTAAKALQVQVHRLRRLLGPERIETAPGGYRLHVEPGELDADRFESALAIARGELAGGDAPKAARTLRQALELWRGAPYADVADRGFAGHEAARLEELRAVATEERIEADLALARHHDLIGELTALSAAEPQRERLYAQLMLALYRAGRQTEALETYHRARRALRDSAGLEPGPQLRELERAILAHDHGLAVEPPELPLRRHLPAPPTRIVGREAELHEVDGLIRRDGVRLVTLLGAGGIGKTRLALQAAHGLADAFDDGVWFVDLAPLREPGLVLSAIAHALTVEEHGDRPLRDTLVAFLRARRLLLVLDNFEVVEDEAPLVADLLAAAPGLVMLATSRAPLRLAGEHEVRLEPLPVADAVTLFAARAAAVAPRFRRPAAEAEAVADICRRLDCLPLAIELAAARTREYAPEEMLALLEPIELAAGGPRDLPERQRTLRATIEWSSTLLQPAEQALFARLAVFAGGCTADAAKAICGAGRPELAALAARSLLTERPGSGGPRFAMLETVRSVALEHLADEAEEDRRRHAAHYTELAEEANRSSDADETAWRLLDDDHDNLRAALAWSHDAGEVTTELRLVAALARYWVVRGHLGEGRRRLAAAVGHGDGAPAELLAPALAGDTLVAHSLGDYARMRASAERALELFSSLGDERGIAWSLQRLGSAITNQGNAARGIELNTASVERFRGLDDDRGLASALNNLACALLAQGEAAAAVPLFEEALACFRRLGRPQALPVPLSNLGLAALLQGDHATALARFGEGVALADELGYLEACAYGLEGLAAALAGLGRPADAVRLLGAADAAAESVGITLEPLEQGIHDETEAALRAALPPAAFAAAFAEGRALAPAAALAVARGA
jgi:predicted ATPase/DNA-binding SARP family transcriptional activator